MKIGKWLIGLLVVVMFLGWGQAFGANDMTKTPLRIDTFGADVTIDTGRIFISTIVITAYSSAKTVTFINSDAEVVLVIECPSGETVTWPSAKAVHPRGVEFAEGFIFDDSASDLAANDFIFIWKE